MLFNGERCQFSLAPNNSIYFVSLHDKDALKKLFKLDETNIVIAISV